MEDTADSSYSGTHAEAGMHPPSLSQYQESPVKKSPMNLSAALKFYCGLELTNAHNAIADVDATLHVLLGQLEM